MLKFSDAQTYALIASDDDFAAWYCDEFMREQLPEFYHAVWRVGRWEMCLQGRAYARQLGIKDVPSQAMFVTLMWQIAPDFFTRAGFVEAALDDALDGPAKIDAFFGANEDLAVDAMTTGLSGFWYPSMIPLDHPWRDWSIKAKIADDAVDAPHGAEEWQ